MSREFFRLAHVVFPGGGEAGGTNATGNAGGALTTNGSAAVAPATGAPAAGAPAAGNMPAGDPPCVGQMTNTSGGNTAAAQLAVGAYLPAAAPALAAPTMAPVANPAAASTLANAAGGAGGGMAPAPANPAMAPPAGEMAPAGGSAGDAGAGVGWRLGDQAHRIGQPLAFQRLRTAAPILENAWEARGTATGGKDATPKKTWQQKMIELNMIKVSSMTGQLKAQKMRWKAIVLRKIENAKKSKIWTDDVFKQIMGTDGAFDRWINQSNNYQISTVYGDNEQIGEYMVNALYEQKKEGETLQ